MTDERLEAWAQEPGKHRQFLIEQQFDGRWSCILSEHVGGQTVYLTVSGSNRDKVISAILGTLKAVE